MKTKKKFLVTIVFIVICFSIFYTSFVNANITNIDDSQIVLLTGFEPFGTYKVNPSELIAETLDGQVIDGAFVTGIVLPVDFEESVENITRAIDEYNPILVISVGLNAKAQTIDVEEISINLKRYTRNESILWFIPRFLDFGSPLFRVSRLQTREIVDNIKTEDIPVKRSYFAGAYVCNAVFYKTLAYVDENDLSIDSGFIHVPLLDYQNPDGMKLETMIEAVTIAIQTSLD